MAAQEYLGEMGAALARSSWNITVRHAQEVVELAVKGVLCYLCIDYPKVHDAADLLVAALTARRMSLSEEEAADLRAVSSRLAEQRAPAFYFEYDEERGTAEIAVARRASHPPALSQDRARPRTAPTNLRSTHRTR